MDTFEYSPNEYHSTGCPMRLCQFTGTCDKCPFRLLFQISNWLYDRFAQPYEIASYIYDRLLLDYPTLTSKPYLSISYNISERELLDYLGINVPNDV